MPKLLKKSQKTDRSFLRAHTMVWEKRAKEVEAAGVLVDQSQEQNHGPGPILQGDTTTIGGASLEHTVHGPEADLVVIAAVLGDIIIMDHRVWNPNTAEKSWKVQIDIVTNGRNLVHVLRASPEITPMFPRNTGMNEDTTETDERGLVHLKDLIKASTIAVAVQHTAGTDANWGNCSIWIFKWYKRLFQTWRKKLFTIWFETQDLQYVGLFKKNYVEFFALIIP